MTFDYFEGPAGTGKTHSLVVRADELVREGALESNQKALALTFMNGARRRLDERLRDYPAMRRRFECQTFDVFARTLAGRRRSLITPSNKNLAANLNDFDGPCCLAASLLEHDTVRDWVARTFPLIIVDEAQDLDPYRARLLQELSRSCQIVAAADAFQCLNDKNNPAHLTSWLESAGQTHHLSQPRRTGQQGLLAAALAVRNGEDIKAVLKSSTSNGSTKWRGAGFLLFDVVARKNNCALLAWTIANEICSHPGATIILTPDAKNTIVRNALQTVITRRWTRKNSKTAFGPYRVEWERSDAEAASDLLRDVVLPAKARCAEFQSALTHLAQHAAIAQALRRMDRIRRVCGRTEFVGAEILEFVRESMRNQSRFGFREHRDHTAMTIQRAKNREFPNVIVLWPHSATGSAGHQRRLLYNAITRAQNHCTVIVLGKNRLNTPPFAPSC